MKTKKKTTKKKAVVKKVVKKKIIKKKAVKKPAPKKIVKKEKKIGKVTHYFDKIKVVAIKLSDTISVGDTVRIVGGEDTDFKQKISSMQFKHEKLKKAKKGQEVGIKVKDRAREGYKIFKV
ncbi:MAG: EF-Tu/IF-2/RF-3 family GTPase [Candidatus Pacebacteria bacterium]|nr:EF-Tu/IF-2/RF-3 family GTPase [Candidatus Paceibacterota bacterium]